MYVSIIWKGSFSSGLPCALLPQKVTDVLGCDGWNIAQQVEGDPSPPVSTGVLHPVLDYPVHERHGESSAKGHRDDEWAAASFLWETSEGVGTVQPGGEKAQGESINMHKQLTVGCKKDGATIFPVVPSTRTRGSLAQTGCSLRPSVHAFFVFLFFFFVCEGVWALAQVVQRGWRLHPLRYSKTMWTWSWAANLGGPAWAEGLEQVTSSSPF